jgi:hypothetical protein
MSCLEDESIILSQNTGTNVILIPCIIKYVENDQHRVVRFFIYMMALMCFDKAMPSSGSD